MDEMVSHVPEWFAGVNPDVAVYEACLLYTSESGKHSSRINVSSLRAAMKAEAEKRVLNIHI